MKRFLPLLGICMVSLWASSGCGGSTLDANSPCRDYLQASGDEKSAGIAGAADELDTSISVLSAPNIDNNCGIDQDQTLGEVVERFGGT